MSELKVDEQRVREQMEKCGKFKVIAEGLWPTLKETKFKRGDVIRGKNRGKHDKAIYVYLGCDEAAHAAFKVAKGFNSERYIHVLMGIGDFYHSDSLHNYEKVEVK